ncbi:hypothetical protein [Marinisporobacter balticus]|uniref:Uncharacterized protein n=1 Tax=Marinisporobacter balticus TaxID=2018667 RepID=A0A4R2L2L7_9FIRM|nr:hypothetical protein [Marinisporobacter balticus]TCO78006.1 hypothetical protein EV214_105105 [Marinisporobacter balticus]
MAKITWKSKQQIEDEKTLESIKPTEEEIKKAEIEIQILNLLGEVGLI